PARRWHRRGAELGRTQATDRLHELRFGLEPGCMTQFAGRHDRLVAAKEPAVADRNTWEASRQAGDVPVTDDHGSIFRSAWSARSAEQGSKKTWEASPQAGTRCAKVRRCRPCSVHIRARQRPEDRLSWW